MVQNGKTRPPLPTFIKPKSEEENAEPEAGFEPATSGLNITRRATTAPLRLLELWTEIKPLIAKR